MKYNSTNSAPFHIANAKRGDRVLIDEVRLYGDSAGRPCLGLAPDTPVTFVKALRAAPESGLNGLVEVKHGQWYHMVWESDLRSPLKGVTITSADIQSTIDAVRRELAKAQGWVPNGGFATPQAVRDVLTSGEHIIKTKRPDASRLIPFDPNTVKRGDKLWVTTGFESNTEFMFIGMDSGTVIVRATGSVAMSSQYRCFAPQFLLSVKSAKTIRYALGIPNGVMGAKPQEFMRRVDSISAHVLSIANFKRITAATVTPDGLLDVTFSDENASLRIDPNYPN